MAQKHGFKFSTKVGSYIIIYVTGYIGTFIGEVTSEELFQIKVEEEGVFSCLREGDYIILENSTALFQADRKKFFKERVGDVFSGLKSLGVESGKLVPVCLLEE